MVSRNIMEVCLTIVLLLGVSITKVVGRPTGAPAAACTTITPSHGGSTATGPVPYNVNISSLDGGYIPGQNYTITLSGSSDNADFLGFLVQGRVMADDTTSAGTFMDNGDDQHTVCTGNTGITHDNNTPKTSVQLVWNAPSTGTGTILFRYAFVDDYSIYWSNQATGTVSEATVTTATTSDIIVSTTTTSSLDIMSSSSTITTMDGTSTSSTTIADDMATSSTTTADDMATSTTTTTDATATPSSTMTADVTLTSSSVDDGMTMSSTATMGVSATPTATPEDRGGGAAATGVTVANSAVILLLVSVITLIN